MATAKDSKPTDNKVDGLAADEPGPGAGEVQKAVDEAEDKGYYGMVPDPTDNEAYTVSGVVKGMPTPETDAKQADEAVKAQRDLAGPGNGPGPR